MNQLIGLLLILALAFTGCADRTASKPGEGSPSTSASERSKNSQGGGGGY
jgi:hypothetical protein